MKVLIVDDENKSRETLQTLIQEYCEGVTICGLAGNVVSALPLIATHNPDLVFLDISMPGGNGFELLKKVEEITFEVVFVTAYDSYGIAAVKANALDYLLKPVSIEEMRGAIEKARQKLSTKKPPNDYSILLHQLELNSLRRNKKIAIPASEGLVFISPSEIISLTADGSYTSITLASGKKILSTRHLKEYEVQLPSASFIRVHHSHIINLEYVNQYQRGEGGYVMMSDGSEIMISKRKKKDFLDRFIP